MATKPVSVESRPLSRVRDGVSLEPSEDLYYKKDEGYKAKRKVSNAGAGRGFVNPEMDKPKKYTSGGKVKARGVGCAMRGHGKA